MGEAVLAENFRSSPRWLPGTVFKRIGPVTYLVKVKNGCWKRHVDQLLGSCRQGLDEQVEDTDLFEAVAGQETNPEAEAEITGTESSDEPSCSTGEDQDASTTGSTEGTSTMPEPRYPQRLRRPPDRLAPYMNK